MPRDHHGRFAPASAARFDGMYSVLSGLGDPLRDKARMVALSKNSDLNLTQIEALYHDHGMSAKIVDQPANDLTREGCEIDDFDGDLKATEAELRRVGALGAVSDLYRWGSAYGGAILGAAVDDGLEPHEPLDTARIRSVRGLFVLDRWTLSPLWSSGRSMGDPDGYTILTDGPEAETLRGRVIHASRTIKFCGATPLTRRQKQLRQGWGVSVYQRVWESFRRLLTAYGYAETILQDVSVDVFLINGLVEAFKSGKEDLVRKRLMALQLGKSVINGIALDAGDGDRKPEAYVPQQRSVTGVRDLVDVFVQALVAAVPIPRSELLGETTGGMNTGTNSGEKRTYNAFVKGHQTNYATPWLGWILDILFAAKDGPTGGVPHDEREVRWRPLLAPSDTEAAELAHKRAQADEILWRIGGASADDVAYTRVELGSHGDLVRRPDDVDPPDLPDEEDVDPAPVPEPLPGDATPDAGVAAAAGGDIQAAALNGAQWKEIRELAGQIVRGELPLEFGTQLLLIGAPGVVRDETHAVRILSSLKGFKPTAQQVASAPSPAELDEA